MTFRHRLASALVYSALILLCATPVLAQGNPSVLLEDADQFFENANYDASAIEYQRFLFFAPRHSSAYYAYFKLGLAEQKLARHDKALQAFRQAARLAPSARDREYISYRLALAYLNVNQLDRAKLELLRLTVSMDDSTMATQASILTGVAFSYQQNWEQAGEMFEHALSLQRGNIGFEDAMGNALALTARLFRNPTVKSPSLSKWMSTFLPGSGQAYAGWLGTGATTLAVNAGTSYLVYRSVVERSYVDAVLIASLVWWRYYNGNRARAEEAAEDANRTFRLHLEWQLQTALEEASQFISSQEYSLTPPSTR